MPVETSDLEQYKTDMQDAFQKGFEADFGKTEDFVGDGKEGMFRFQKRIEN